MDQKKKRIFNLSVAVFSLLISAIIFSLALIGFVVSLKAPFHKPIEYSLDWLPKEHPRDIERFTVGDFICF